jgi:hypothetical protein
MGLCVLTRFSEIGGAESQNLSMFSLDRARCHKLRRSWRRNKTGWTIADDHTIVL